MLLPTSGSTGNPKLVRLSRAAVLRNADAIADVLGIDADEVAPTSLPLLLQLRPVRAQQPPGARRDRGAVERTGVMAARRSGTAVDADGVTSLAGVPYHYEMLRRLRFDPAKYPTLRTLTQAGGKLRDDLVTDFNEQDGAPSAAGCS